MDRRFLLPSPAYHEMQLLLRLDRAGSLALPLDPRDFPPSSLQSVHIAGLIQDKLLVSQDENDEGRVMLTELGRAHMRRLVVDYQLELIGLREASDEFFRERVQALVGAGYRRVVLYGASDTARALIEFLRQSPINVVAIIDDRQEKQGTSLAGFEIVAPASLSALEFDTVVVTTVDFEKVILRERVAHLPGSPRAIGLFEIS
jgi:hypothetical protein